jgi:tRNA(His) 5'-end guanylyltransferase
MNAAAKAVLTELPDIVIAYGISDEYRYSLLFSPKPARNKSNYAWNAVSCSTNHAPFSNGGQGMPTLEFFSLSLLASLGSIYYGISY